MGGYLEREGYVSFVYLDSESEELLLIAIQIALSYDLNAMTKKHLLGESG